MLRLTRRLICVYVAGRLMFAYAVLFPCVTLCAYVTLFVAGVHAEGTVTTLSLVG